MPYMGFVPEEERTAYCAPYGYDAGKTLIYRCRTERFENLVFFQLEDDCLTLLRVIDDPKDRQIFGSLVRGALKYGEQHPVLDVAFSPELDDEKLLRFGFLQHKEVRCMRFYMVGKGDCSCCGHQQ